MSILAISAALSSKFLAAKAIASLVVGCYATAPASDAVQIHCFVGTAEGHVLADVESKVVKVPGKGFALSELATAYGVGVEAALSEAARTTQG